MPDQVQLHINGQRVTVPAGTVVAAALAMAGITRFRRSVTDEPRGPLCGMGTCMECRVTIDGQAHSRSCQTLCAEGMDVKTDADPVHEGVNFGAGTIRPRTHPCPETISGGDEPSPPLHQSALTPMTDREIEVVVVGAGPAGLAAACAASESGRRVALVDETPWLGGQIWRGQQRAPSIGSAGEWFARLGRSKAVLLDRTCVVAAPEPGLLLAEREGQPCQIRWSRLILATGARELFLPFPGWTLPGVMGPGGLLSLVKNGWPVQGQRIVIAGSGPLLLAAAKGLAENGARVLTIAEQAARNKVIRFGFGLYRHPAKLLQALWLKLKVVGVPLRFGTWPIRAEGKEKIRSVTLTNGERTWTEGCDLLACGFGLVPNTELPAALGCEIANGSVRVDSWQATSVGNVYCAGETTGIGGADCALVEGQIAGFASAGNESRAQALFERRASWHRFRSDLAQSFALRPELKSLAEDGTIVCRCEDVPLGRLRQFQDWREAKLHARCGMGPCQGRVCGPGTKELLGWGMGSVRPPVCPAKVQSLIASP